MTGLALFRCNPSEFMRRYITEYETWIHFYTPETKEQSKQWTAPGELARMKVKSARKVKNGILECERNHFH